MNFRQLEIFRAVVMTGTTSGASELLEISQPAVSRSLSELERSLQFDLFDRVKGRLVLTPNGSLFFREVTDGFEVFNRLRTSSERIRDFGSGIIRISSLAALGSTLVPRAIPIFQEQHPDVAVTVVVESSHQVHDGVSSGQVDIGLAAEEIDLSRVLHQVFSTVSGVCALPPDSDLRHLKVIRPEHLHDRNFVTLAPGDRVREQLTEVFRASDVRPRIKVETPNSTTVCALVLEGVGIGIVNPMAVDGFVERGVHLRKFQPSVQFKTFLLHRPDMPKSTIVKSMVAALLKARTQTPTGALRTRR